MSSTWRNIKLEVLKRSEHEFCHETLRDDLKWLQIEKECKSLVEKRMAKGEIIAGTELLLEVVKKYV